MILLSLCGDALAVASPLNKTAWESGSHAVLHLKHLYNVKKCSNRKNLGGLGMTMQTVLYEACY